MNADHGRRAGGETRKIGIVSDTRITGGQALPPRLKQVLDGVDVIIHAGNAGSQAVLDELATIAPVEAVAGPLDDANAFSPPLPSTRRLEINGYNILVACEVDPSTIESGTTDILISGNTCIPNIKETREIRLMINPGSPTFPARQNRGTVAIVKLGTLLFCYIVKV